METKLEIHETAFVTSTFRSFSEELSRDPYARLWNNEKTDAWIKDYIKDVSEEEPYTHCIRNRYFLDTIEALFENKKVEVLINFGCGFSMYPYFLPEKLIHIEIDKPDIIEYKKDRVNAWQQEGQLSRRNIHYIGVDFNETYEEDLSAKIAAIKGNRSSFILLEGVLFFLSREVTEKLFHLFAALQKSDDYVGSVSYRENIIHTPVFERLLHFFNTKVLKDELFQYQTIDDVFYENLPGYQLLETQDYSSLYTKYHHTPRVTNSGDILNETYYLLQKK